MLTTIGAVRAIEDERIRRHHGGYHRPGTTGHRPIPDPERVRSVR